MRLSELELTIDATDTRIAIIEIQENSLQTQSILSGYQEKIEVLGVSSSNLLKIKVLTIQSVPLLLKRLLSSGQFDTVSVLGFISPDDIPVTDCLVAAAANSITQLSIEMDIPVINGIYASKELDPETATLERFGADVAANTVTLHSLIETVDNLWD